MTAVTMENIASRDNRLAVFGSVLLVLIYLGRVQELIPPLSGVGLGKIVFVIAILFYLMSPHKNSIKLTKVPQVRYVLGIFSLGLLSIPFGVWPGESFRVMTEDLLKLLLFFLLILKSINTIKDIKTFVWGIALSVLTLGFFTLGLEKVGRLAVSSTYDPNDLAFVMVVFLPLVYYLARNEAGPKKTFLYATMGIMVVTIVFTVSRGGFLGLIGVSVLMMIRQGKKVGSMILPAVMLIILFSVFAPAAYWERMSTMLEPSKDYNMQEGVSGRKEVWTNGIKLMMANPVLGVGAGGFQVAEGLLHEGKGKWSAAHNSFIEIGAELGIPGLTLFILLIFRSVQHLRRMRANPENQPILWLLNGTEIGIYGYVITGFFLSQAYSSALYLLIGITILLMNIKGGTEQRGH